METYDGKVERSLYYCAIGICQACHYNSERHDECMRHLIKDACEAGHTDEIIIEDQQTTIRKQKAEIERLQKDKADIIDAVEYRINQAKESAYKEFAEKLKTTDLSGTVGEKYVNGEMYGYFHNGAFERIVDNLLAELTLEPLTKIDHSSLCETETYEG